MNPKDRGVGVFAVMNGSINQTGVTIAPNVTNALCGWIITVHGSVTVWASGTTSFSF
jgi:hypothetical protein